MKHKTRAELAGENLGRVIAEMVHLMYQNDTARKFWTGLMRVLEREDRRSTGARKRSTP